MKQLCRSLLLILGLAHCLTAHGQFTDEPKQYSYQMVTNFKDGRSGTMRLYVDGDKRRVETEVGARPMILIYRGDQGKSYVILPEQKSYMETPLNPQVLQRFKNPRERIKQRGGSFQKAGVEEVNGQICDKYAWNYTRPSSGVGHAPAVPKLPSPSDVRTAPISGTTWISQRTHLPVKSETDRFTMETRNVKLGSPDPSLFEPPADYKKVGAPD